MSYTAGDQINRALRLLGVLAEGETPSASESMDALAALNQMLDSWSTERLAVYSTQEQVFTWPAGAGSRTLGPTGDLAGVRPVSLDDATYFKVNGLSYGVGFLNDDQYNAIPLKGATSTLPQYLYLNPSFPDATLRIYPVPTQDLEFHLVSVQPLDQPVALNTALAFPPGYLRAFAYNLALEIAPEFGVEPSKDVRRIAVASKRNLKRVNDPGDVLGMPAGLPLGPGRFNVFSGDR